MSTYSLDPLQDARWAGLLEWHPAASVFHSRGWLMALRETHGYEPFVLTMAPPGSQLTDGIVFCRVRSWLTGRRLVSLPFSDHCQPLVDSAESWAELISAATGELKKRGWKYLELRSLNAGDGERPGGPRLSKCRSYVFHQIDLRPGLEDLYAKLHKNHIQRKIQKANREKLNYKAGVSDSLLKKFYHLMILTRRRHGVPPQPIEWFRNLVRWLGDNVCIRVVSKDERPIASILTLQFKNTVVYKYGCSDAAFHNLGGMALLFWETIREGKTRGAEVFDLGRSEPENEGLIAFKDHLGASSCRLEYLRYPAGPEVATAGLRKWDLFQWISSRLPDFAFVATGKWLYRHMG